ncbi:hypothetical protein V5799_005469 [Amblyomma americanum]|uniref:Uncharacterized protein n=1 Tax=Amblyomma americanum TaxID=6943 RepID=A0AAQ4DZ60_AMBAM
MFDESFKVGGRRLTGEYRAKLLQATDSMFAKYSSINSVREGRAAKRRPLSQQRKETTDRSKIASNLTLSAQWLHTPFSSKALLSKHTF